MDRWIAIVVVMAVVVVLGGINLKIWLDCDGYLVQQPFFYKCLDKEALNELTD